MESNGKTYWKSLKEMAQTPEFKAEHANAIHNEFPENYDKPSSGMSRRSFVGLLSASMALAATGCRRPDYKIVPYVKGVEYLTPGLPNFYATSFSHGNAAIGLLVKSREGRPIKIEGNDLHPASLGKSSAIVQATLLSLYDPDRMQKTRIGKEYVPVEKAIEHIASAINSAQGKSVRILIDEHCSPSFAALMNEIETAFPSVKFITMPAIQANNTAEANKAVLGIDAEFVPDYSKSDVILSVDNDFLGIDKNSVYHTQNFTKNRRPTTENPKMNRLIVAESILSVTGANADKRVRLSPDEFEGFLAAVLNEVAEKTNHAELKSIAKNIKPSTSADVKAVAEELAAHGKKGIVAVGSHLSPLANAMGIAINYAIGAISTESAINPAHQLPFSGSKQEAKSAFIAELKSGNVSTVIFADVNPEYSADQEFKELLRKVPNRFAMSLYEDDSAVPCSVYIPIAHYLECWGDTVAFDGTLSVQQPLIAPLNTASMPLGDILLQLTKKLNSGFQPKISTYYDYVKARWQADWNAKADKTASPTFDAFWDKCLRDGIFRTAEMAQVPVFMKAGDSLASASNMKSSSQSKKAGEMFCCVTPSYALYDGKYANNGWLQELPDPITKATWENLALLSPKTAKDLDAKEGDVVSVTTATGSIEIPVWIQPGLADGVVGTTLGFGRVMGGIVLRNAGANAYGLLGADQNVGFTSASVKKTGKNVKIAVTQSHHSFEGREIVKETTFEKIEKKEKDLFERVEVPGRAKGDETSLPLSIVQPFDYKGHKWGMIIDMSACTGCNACVIACQAENNIPIVGKEQVIKGREMHWIRLDRYYQGDDANPEVVIQPMLCQHCDNAPCENVCPVAATTHSPEGLNEMVYNRCVGTRYCGNNCPYKVRRFNYLNFHPEQRSPIELVFNPEVTVRMRGIMEKCTFCVQRITEGKYKAKDQGRIRVNDGEIVTACEQACPASAIIFGDSNSHESRVAKMRTHERGYLILEEINVRPQVTYLAKVRNSQAGAEHHS